MTNSDSEPAEAGASTSAASPAPRSMFALDLLEGSTALVTGGGTGLGLAIAHGLSAAGADVVIAARRQDVLDEAAAGITAVTGNPV
ncbi:SDR family NAD(P)-dependent oxidoreductase, partial [Ilumatobacter sp.]|uniref:SDR family NAD(P)-dependent oxidoreductase n=1 Tax=Ilumatobacter sp. TaxID=1967498 RepID=UPI003C3B77B0